MSCVASPRRLYTWQTSLSPVSTLWTLRNQQIDWRSHHDTTYKFSFWQIIPAGLTVLTANSFTTTFSPTLQAGSVTCSVRSLGAHDTVNHSICLLVTFHLFVVLVKTKYGIDPAQHYLFSSLVQMWPSSTTQVCAPWSRVGVGTQAPLHLHHTAQSWNKVLGALPTCSFSNRPTNKQQQT